MHGGEWDEQDVQGHAPLWEAWAARDEVAGAEAAPVVVTTAEMRTMRTGGRLLVVGRRRPIRSGMIRPRSAADLVALLNADVITLDEARRYLRLGRFEEVHGSCG